MPFTRADVPSSHHRFSKGKHALHYLTASKLLTEPGHMSTTLDEVKVLTRAALKGGSTILG